MLTDEEREPNNPEPPASGLDVSGQAKPELTVAETDRTEDEKTEPVRYHVSVKTGDRDGAGTDADVYITLIGQHGKSKEFKLDFYFFDDFERNSVGDYIIIVDKDLGALKQVVVRRTDSWLASEWFVDAVTVRKDESQTLYIFPCHRWLPPKSFHIQLNDTCLPQFDLNPQQRAADVQQQKVDYAYTESYPGGPMMVGTYVSSCLVVSSFLDVSS